ncbi:MAG: arsenate reductase ArsC [Bacteroidetes bacterium]|nr:arsenate reductase ArsC [Bacteroidota bacterium]
MIVSKSKVLFVCTHNSSRSQMAEGILRHLYDDHYEVHSAGTEPGGVSPFAVRVMEEIGINIQHHTSKDVHEFLTMYLDTVITVCDSAQEQCPFVPARVNLHHRFEDPRATTGSDEEKLAAFRRVRDEIHLWVQDYFKPSFS